MGKIVAAMAAVHAPQLITRPPFEDQAMLDRSADALKVLGATLDETDPDVLIVIGTDHLETFWLGAVPTFAVVASEEARCEFGSEELRVPIHLSLAQGLIEGLIDKGFDLTYSIEASLGHAFLGPLRFIRGSRPIPVVPILVNAYLPPLPSPRRCAALGEAIAAVISSRPENVAIIASGGMSHFPGTRRYHEPAYAFDDWVIQEVTRGDWGDLLDLTPVQLDEVGESELLTWFVLAGAIGPVAGSLLSYQALDHHGHGVVQFIPSLPPGLDPPGAVVPRYGGIRLRQTTYEYYKAPQARDLPLNKVLHRIRSDADFRQAFIDDRPGLLGGLGLRPEQIDAMRADDVERLVAVGAHPLQALAAVQVLEFERRRAGDERC